MVFFSSMTMTVPMGVAKITVWDTVFLTPFGFTPKLEDAVQACKDHDLDPDVCVRPIPVAVSEDGSREPYIR